MRALVSTPRRRDRRCVSIETHVGLDIFTTMGSLQQVTKVKCSVCTLKYAAQDPLAPRVLPCGHMTCMNCLPLVAAAGDGKIWCTRCDPPVANEIPPGGVEAFPKHEQTERLDATPRASEKRSGTKVPMATVAMDEVHLDIAASTMTPATLNPTSLQVAPKNRSVPVIVQPEVTDTLNLRRIQRAPVNKSVHVIVQQPEEEVEPTEAIDCTLAGCCKTFWLHLVGFILALPLLIMWFVVCICVAVICFLGVIAIATFYSCQMALQLVCDSDNTGFDEVSQSIEIRGDKFENCLRFGFVLCEKLALKCFGRCVVWSVLTKCCCCVSLYAVLCPVAFISGSIGALIGFSVLLFLGFWKCYCKCLCSVLCCTDD